MNQDNFIKLALKEAGPKAEIFRTSWDKWLHQNSAANSTQFNVLAADPSHTAGQIISFTTNEGLIVALGIVLLGMFMVVMAGAMVYGYKQVRYNKTSVEEGLLLHLKPPRQYLPVFADK